jgi:lipopolysaccharide/colanic/teichoic acid biosynthesis glycosyltransferase
MGLFRTAVGREPKRLELIIRASGSHPREVSARIVLDEDAFVSMLYLERRRAERADKRYVLMLVDVRDALSGMDATRTSATLTQTVCEITRETDIIGWYVENSLLAVIGTEIGQASPEEIRQVLSEKFRAAFSGVLGKERASLIFVSFHFFPEERENNNSNGSGNIALYPDLCRKGASQRLALDVKRLMDVFGSACALILLSPLFVLIALAIKLTSKGPVLFRQERLGQYGKRFKLVKFRSMRTNCDSKIHEEYVSRFIAGQFKRGVTIGEKQVFKLEQDPRITRVGAFLRKTSLDELPQFWNVLTGAMSLVGPRPPLEYEFKAYEVWHRRRVLEIKPGITGLWQVEGRSRTQFDDMVRMDLNYACKWSIWLDLKILLRTPAAVLSGDGAH